MIWRAGTLILSASISGWLAYKVVDREIPVIVLEKSSEKQEYLKGEVFRAEYRFFRHRSCFLRVYRLLWDASGERFVVPDLTFEADILPLGNDEARVPTMLPRTMAAGKATYRTVNCYRCNFTHYLWPVCDAPRDIEFEVLNKEASNGRSGN